MFFVNVFEFLFQIDAVYPVYRACPVINAAVYSGNNCTCLVPDYCKLLFEQAGRPTVVCELLIIAGGNPKKRQKFSGGRSLIMV